jgi:hypothetical protein
MGLADVETSRLYSFEKGGPTRLEIRWRASFRELRVLVDGELVGTLEKKKIPREGAKLALPDGSTLSVRLSGLLGIELLRNGAALPGSDLDPRRVLRNAAFLMAVGACLDFATDGAMLRRALQLESLGVPAAASFWARPQSLPLVLDVTLLALAVPTFLGSRIALGVGIAAFASRFGLDREHSPWTLIYGVVTTWALATHFFATLKRRR